MKVYRKFQSKHQQGYTLIELGIGIAIIAILTAFIVGFSLSYYKKTRLNNEARDMDFIQGEITRHYSADPSTFPSMTDTVLISFDLVPKSWRVTASTMKSPRYGAATFAPATLNTTNDSVSMTINNVPTSDCKELVKARSESYRQITVAGTVVKPDGGSVNDTTLATQCESAATVAMVWLWTRS